MVMAWGPLICPRLTLFWAGGVQRLASGATHQPRRHPRPRTLTAASVRSAWPPVKLRVWVSKFSAKPPPKPRVSRTPSYASEVLLIIMITHVIETNVASITLAIIRHHCLINVERDMCNKRNVILIYNYLIELETAFPTSLL